MGIWYFGKMWVSRRNEMYLLPLRESVSGMYVCKVLRCTIKIFLYIRNITPVSLCRQGSLHSSSFCQWVKFGTADGLVNRTGRAPTSCYDPHTHFSLLPLSSNSSHTLAGFGYSWPGPSLKLPNFVKKCSPWSSPSNITRSACLNVWIIDLVS
jgi:hypothetical protein